MIKPILEKLFKFYPLWIVLVAIFYFSKNSSFFESFNPNVDFVQIILYFNVILIGGFIFVFAAPQLIKLLKIKSLNALHFLGLLLLSIIFVNISTLYRGYSIYNGPTIIQTEAGIKYYENESISYDDIILQKGAMLYKEKLQKLNLPDEVKANLKDMSFLSSFLGISSHTGLAFLKLLLFLFCILSAGLYPIRLFSKENTLRNAVLGFGLGTVIFSLLLFLLARFSWLNVTSVGILLGLSGILGLSQIKKLWEITKSSSIDTKNFSIKELALAYAFLLLIAWNFSEAMEPLPIGFDDASVYLNLPNLIAHFGTLINNNAIYAFSLIQGAAEILDPAGSLKKTLVFGFGTLAILPIYLLLKDYIGKKYSLWTLAVYLLTPSIFAHNFLQLKTEMPLLFIGTLSILCASIWMKEKKLSWLALAGLFAGFAFTIKITAIFLVFTLIALAVFKLFSILLGIWASAFLFVFALFTANFSGERPTIAENHELRNVLFIFLAVCGIFIIFHSIKNKVFSLRKFLELSVLACFMLIPLAPWAASNMYENQQIDIQSIFINKKVDFPVVDMISDSCTNEGIANLDYKRYLPSHGGKFLNLLLLPWDLSMDTAAKSFITNIGFLFLALCPAVLFRLRKENLATPLCLAGIFFGIFWAVMAKGIIWYAFSGFAFLLLLFGKSLSTTFESSRLTKYTSFVAILLFLTLSFFYRSNMFISRAHSFVPYYSGLASYGEYMNNVYPEYSSMAAVLNESTASKIYLTDNAFLNYFIEANNTRVYRDPFLDSFDCANKTGLALEKLRNNFDYLVISAPVYDPDFGQSLFERSSALLQLAQENFTYITGGKDSYLFKVD